MTNADQLSPLARAAKVQIAEQLRKTTKERMLPHEYEAIALKTLRKLCAEASAVSERGKARCLQAFAASGIQKDTAALLFNEVRRRAAA